MVNQLPQSADGLSRVFGALSDPTRRGILEQLSRGETNVGRLAAPYAISPPAVSKHLRVLEDAGLIRRTRAGREHRIKVGPRPIDEARDWIAEHVQYWKRHFDAVEDYLARTGKLNSKEDGE